MKLSYTALKTFQQCHFRYHLRYNRGLPSRPRPAAQSSRALHGALHLFYQGLKNQQAGKDVLFPQPAVSLETLLAYFKGYYDNPYMDEVFLTLKGEHHYLRRAVDQ